MVNYNAVSDGKRGNLSNGMRVVIIQLLSHLLVRTTFSIFDAMARMLMIIFIVDGVHAAWVHWLEY
jgi:hypothetical protein